MSHTIVGKLNRNASIFQAGESTGFGIRLGVKYYDRETQQNEWTNYEAAIFAKQPNQIQFYQNALVEGSVIEVSGDALKIKSFDGQNGQQLSIEILNAKLGYVHTGQQANSQQQPQYQQQQAPQQQYNQQPQQQGGFAAPQQQQGFSPQQNQNPPF